MKWLSPIVVLIVLTIGIIKVEAEEVFIPEIDFNVLARVESSMNRKAHSSQGARGLFQLRKIAWRDVQRHYPDLKKYSYHVYVYDPQVSRLFARKYIGILARYLQAHEKPVTIENLFTAYNAGITYVIYRKPLRRETQVLIKRYKELAYD